MAKEMKKELQEFTVEEKLKSLYQLQVIFSEIDRIKTLRGELPLEVQDLEDEVAGLRTRIGNISGGIEEIKAEEAKRRNKIEEAKAMIEKYTEDQNNVRNNREYDLLAKEIEFQTLEVEFCEKKLRQYAGDLKAKNEEIDRTNALLEERLAALEDKRNELEEIVSETKEEEEKLRDRAKVLEATIEPRLLQSFKRIRKNTRNGLGVVYVQRDACGGCFNKIPPQRQLDIKMRKKIIVCEYCGRIMIDPELAGVKETTVQAPEKKTRKRAIRKKGDEAAAAAVVEAEFRRWGFCPQRVGNNVWAEAWAHDESKPTILLDAHLDTVKPNAAWVRDPFTPTLEGESLYGLGSNDIVPYLCSPLQNGAALQPNYARFGRGGGYGRGWRKSRIAAVAAYRLRSCRRAYIDAASRCREGFVSTGLSLARSFGSRSTRGGR